ncbi:hypothetical protein [Prevotella nigrescens]|uniref:hypothetical protein n=1 Tax=Prevotella nigrescens TaxID=28133 RepID=UPI0015C5E70E|nr:hypothetical protein [Prevotella nigrescens]
MASAIFLFRISPEIVTELRQLSLRGYGNRRYGVTIIVATKQINTDAPKHRE